MSEIIFIPLNYLTDQNNHIEDPSIVSRAGVDCFLWRTHLGSVYLVPGDFLDYGESKIKGKSYTDTEWRDFWCITLGKMELYHVIQNENFFLYSIKMECDETFWYIHFLLYLHDDKIAIIRRNISGGIPHRFIVNIMNLPYRKSKDIIHPTRPIFYIQGNLLELDLSSERFQLLYDFNRRFPNISTVIFIRDKCCFRAGRGYYFFEIPKSCGVKIKPIEFFIDYGSKIRYLPSFPELIFIFSSGLVTIFQHRENKLVQLLIFNFSYMICPYTPTYIDDKYIYISRPGCERSYDIKIYRCDTPLWRISWTEERLLWLAILKEDYHVCQLSRVPREILAQIISYLQDWLIMIDPTKY